MPAYGRSHARSARLRPLGIADRLMRRPLPCCPAARSAATPRSSRCGGWSEVVGTLKRSTGYQRLRYRGLARNTTASMWRAKALAYNLRRADRLLAATASP